MDTGRDNWSRNELEEVFGIYNLTKTSIHKSNTVIINLALKLGKKIRGVENQLLMFRAVEKELKEKMIYGRKNYNKLIKEIYIEKTAKMENTDSVYQEMNSKLNYPQRFNNFVKTNDGAVRRSSDELSGRPIGEMIILPIHEFINKVVLNSSNEYKILFLIGGPGNGKTDATDYAFDTFISSQKITQTETTEIRKSYANKFAYNDNYYSFCEIHNNSFYCIQDATARMKSNNTSLEAFIEVYQEFKKTAGGLLIVCINRGVLQDFLKQTANNSEINNLIKEVDDCSNLEAYFKNKSNLNIGFNYHSFESAISIYPLDKSSLFSANSEVHRNICDLIYYSDWTTSDNKNFNRDYFLSMSKDLADLINLYEIKNNKKLTFREYYHWLHILFTPDKVALQTLTDTPLLHLWKLAPNQSISSVIELISKLKHIELKKELNPLLTDLQKLSHLIDQNKSIKSVQEFNPSFISTLWDTEQIYSLITLIRDEISTPNFNINNGLKKLRQI
jgi:hypothetical protein